MRVLVSLFLLLQLVACSSTSAPTRYYLLNPAPAETPNLTVELELMVGPVQVADHLQRRGIVDRRSDHQLHYSATELWASALPQQIPAVLRHSLHQQLPNANLSSFSRSLPKPDSSSHQLMLEILQFDGERGAEIQLVAQWQIYHRPTHQVLAQGGFEQQTSTNDSSYQSLVEGHNRLLSELTRQLVTELVKVTEAQE
ncbi:PqiC family protein [Neiella marina]|uniref:PqiC family protein n=1 Tax=Neiella holothuriorum TaxID=2870530 RepID=A0ABS7EFR3_9GAMM|nr:PqiC family protein [Neiella holothuriorum]MBW8191176.1 PqiC family protein [Neiella holothuriorum]